MTLSREGLVQRISEIVKNALSDTIITPTENFSLHIERKNYWIDLHLGSIYENYLNCPPDVRNKYLEEVMQPFIEDLSRGRSVNAEDILNNKERVYPLVVGANDFHHNFVSLPLAEELQMIYVYDQGLRFFFIEKPLLTDMQMDIEELDKLARKNFYRDMDKPLLVLDKKRGILGYKYWDSYDSTRLLLLQKKFAGIEDLLGEDVLVMIPSRDLLMVFAHRDQAVYNRIKMLGHSHFINSTYPVSKTIYKLAAGRLIKYDGAE